MKDYKQKFATELSATTAHVKPKAFRDALIAGATHYTDFYAAVNRKLSLKREFYVYALLDPRKPGSYSYKLARGKTIEFEFEPFYIGKGKGTRMWQHTSESRKATRPTRKHTKVRKIEGAGLDVIVQRLSSDLIEAVAFAAEDLIIESIGRYADGGILTNASAGGAGSSGYKHTEEARMKMSAAGRGVKKSTEWRERMTGIKRSEETKELLRGPKSAEHAEKIRAAALRRPKVECPHCNKSVALNVAKMWHFDNCKQNPDFDASSSTRPTMSDECKEKIRLKSLQQHRDAPMKTCPHCGATGNKNMERHHFDNCKHAA
ncbi:homing endonuclease [Burkholderia phage BcepSaruman]|uniref:Homing endonuclease n=1 Tax=Burkholderia phage BcepSaruman TaxID=2530032 RepID=A0A4D5ZGK5_9CAUD|nr:homing endonuclease [Burkholderia phage BcepSaruman]QBX06642.1 homing endonuclease [Burkholderia phage BcepSaruman]